MKDYYKVLELERSASAEDIKKSFHRLSRKYHPDVNPNDDEATNKFKEVSEAYDVLGDVSKRADYDRYGSAQGGFNSAQFHHAHDIFSQIFGERQRVVQGPSIRAVVNLSIKQVITGDEVEVKFKRHSLCNSCSGYGGTMKECEACNGMGFKVTHGRITVTQTTCYACRGAGKLIGDKCGSCEAGLTNPEDVTIRMTIPPGVETGMRFVQQGLGNPCAEGMPGDLHVVVKVEEHSVLERLENGNVILSMPCTYSELVLGTQLDVPTLEGSVSVKVPAGTQPGSRFRLREIGFPVFANGRSIYRRGDQYVHIDLDIPKDVEGRHLELVQELAGLERPSPDRQKITDFLGS